MSTHVTVGLLTFGGTLAAVAMACSFPSVSYDDRAFVSPDARTNDADGAATPIDASFDADSLGVRRDDATAKVPDGSCLADDCDCDDDSFFRTNCDAGPTSRPPDCDDFDELRNPNADWTAEPPDDGQVPKGDWNCDGNPEPKFKTNLTCVTTLGASCEATTEGFLDAPPCGATADYYRCNYEGLLNGCKPIKIGTLTQQCR